MRLVCLECSAAYEAPDSLFGPQPREVRCNRCGYQWTVVASSPEANTVPAGPSIAPPPPPPSPPPEPAPPRVAMAPAKRADALAAPTPPPPSPMTVRRSASLADTLAGELTPSESLAVNEGPRSASAAESTRTLLSSGPREEAYIAPPDPEERRLSHDLDFGETARPPRASEGGGTRRTVVILILIILSVGIAAVVFEQQVVAAAPALKSIYAQLGL